MKRFGIVLSLALTAGSWAYAASRTTTVKDDSRRL